MSRIRGRGNKDTELALASIFRRHQITGWRRHQDIPGRPDFIFRRERIAIFVDGCFWHGCPKHCRQPKGNAAFWMKKLSANKTRDKMVNQELRKLGWHVVRIWEHDLAKKKQAMLITRLSRVIPMPTRQT